MSKDKVGKGASHTVFRILGSAKAKAPLEDSELQTARRRENGSAGSSKAKALGPSRSVGSARTDRPVVLPSLTLEELDALGRYAALLERTTLKVKSILKRLGISRTSKGDANLTLPPEIANVSPYLTPAQFGAHFHRSKSFAYRMIYAGRVETIPGMQHSIPVSEVQRFTERSAVYYGPKKPSNRGRKTYKK
jgi:hypothetical protein